MMNIKTFLKTNRLFLAALLLLIVIISVLLNLRTPSVSYRMSPDKLAAMLADSGNQVSPLILYEQLSKNNSNTIPVDIRSTDEFTKGHIEKAVNIPVRELLQKRSISFFRELKKANSIAILYGEDQLQASGPWMLLKQVGIENIRVLQGGYAFYNTLPLPDSLIKIRTADLRVEVPQIDTSRFRKPGQITSIVSPSEGKKAPEKVIPVKKKGSTGGGC